MSADILIVDDEADIRELIGGILEDEGYEPRLAHDSTSALEAIAERRPALVVLDIWLQGSPMDGLELLEVIKAQHPDLPVVIISGHGNIETAVAAIKKGAYDYIEKPFKASRLVLVVNRALEASRLRRENVELKTRTGAAVTMIGESPAMRRLKQELKKIAPTNSRVLISGPMGAGKELAARQLHEWSQRADGPFVVLQAATLAPERMEEALFGTEGDGNGQGRIVGKLEEAHGGTLFIDEVADMPLETQGKVLRVLVDQTFTRVGGNRPVKVDVRIVSSTARDLEALIADGRFRSDLYHRLAVVPIRVPSLAERREDIPLLAEYFIEQHSRASGRAPKRLSEDAMATLQARDWPGNVRQLRNYIERLMILCADGPDVITAEMLPKDSAPTEDDPDGFDLERVVALPLREAREAFERAYLKAQLTRFNGNISRTAQAIGMERSALHRKLKSLGLG
ncbi:sigma-54 dependent transcriptional regulator [Thermopetrobacter sp. TC1]|uniref:nitrogen assimilation response regulator NtrX n=1 Tax=Thermopetrobacter sp. TC1 TaxID=1495045 RepID=UPI000571E273|nr:sigma-54 dependent transcriptional regulator [Thermopetrobacter sp. TC1]